MGIPQKHIGKGEGFNLNKKGSGKLIDPSTFEVKPCSSL